MSGTSAYMPWYIGDYLRDTAHLVAHEHGAYLMMMAHAWQHDGALPLDPERIRKIGRLTPAQWEESSEVLLEFWQKNGTAYRQKRIDIELPRANANYQQKVEAGKQRALQRALSERSAGAIPAAHEPLSQSESESESELDSKAESEPKASKSKAKSKPTPTAAFAAPAGVDAQTWQDYIDHRKAKRSPMTVRAVELIAIELAKMKDPNEAIRQSIRNGWTSIQPVKAAGRTATAPEPDFTATDYRKGVDENGRF